MNDKKEILFEPPSNFRKSVNKNEQINIFNLIFSEIEDNYPIAKIIKKSGEIKYISKNQLIKSSIQLSKIIQKKLNCNYKKQIKVLAIINSSEESLYLMICNMILGAHQCICFEDLKYKSIATRIDLFNPDIIICKENSFEEVKKAKNSSSGNNLNILKININNIEKIKLEVYPEELSKNLNISDPFFSLFTSGSTGKPKLITHQAKDYISYAKFTSNYFLGAKKDKTIFTATDAGWINGHTYAVYGPLANKSKIVICEDFRLISDLEKLEFYINEIKINCFYTSVTLLRLLKSKDKNNSKEFSYECLERIGSCGEPLANEVGKWAINHFNPQRKTIVNTYFQTETGGILVAPRDEDGVCSDYSNVGIPRKELGLDLAKNILSNDEIIDENIDPNEIIIKNKWDGIFKSVIAEKRPNYFTKDGYFRLNDIGFFDKNGFLFIGGRTDDVINTAGHRIASSEIESTALKIEEIYEACAIGLSEYDLGEKVLLFISINENYSEKIDQIISKLRDLISIELSSYHLPEEIKIFNNLPKTKSGKIMRRIMKNIARNLMLDPEGDYTTFTNVENFKLSADNYFNEKIDSMINKNQVIDINKFSKVVGLNAPNKFLLPSLINLLFEIALRSNTSNAISDIYINLKNTSNNKYSYKYSFIKEECNFDNFSKDFIKAPISSEFCMIDIAKITISINFLNNLNILTILKRTSNIKIFNISFENSFKDLEIKKQMKENLTDYSDYNSEKEEDNNLTKINSIPKCLKCRSSVSQMHKQRGEKVYLIPVLDKNNKMNYICDLCFSGW